jgi:hypothetical protein
VTQLLLYHNRLFIINYQDDETLLTDSELIERISRRYKIYETAGMSRIHGLALMLTGCEKTGLRLMV